MSSNERKERSVETFLKLPSDTTPVTVYQTLILPWASKSGTHKWGPAGVGASVQAYPGWEGSLGLVCDDTLPVTRTGAWLTEPSVPGSAQAAAADCNGSHIPASASFKPAQPAVGL